MMEHVAEANRDALRSKIEEAGLTPLQLSAGSNISADRIEEILSSETPMTVPELYGLCQFFGCKFEDFFLGLYDLGTLQSDFPQKVTQEFREKFLLNYFRRIKTANAQDQLCNFVRAIANDALLIDSPGMSAGEP